MVKLIAEVDLGPNPVAVASFSFQFEDEPVVGVRTYILPKLCGLAQATDHHIDPSIVIKVGKCASPMSAHNGQACLGRKIAECSITQINKKTVRLFVVPGAE